MFVILLCRLIVVHVVFSGMWLLCLIWFVLILLCVFVVMFDGVCFVLFCVACVVCMYYCFANCVCCVWLLLYVVSWFVVVGCRLLVVGSVLLVDGCRYRFSVVVVDVVGVGGVFVVVFLVVFVVAFVGVCFIVMFVVVCVWFWYESV